MSRIGLTPVALPKGVAVAVISGEVKVKGPKGELQIPYAQDLFSVQAEESEVRIARHSEEKKVRALHGLVRSLVANAVEGVSQGFSKNLDLFGVGYRAEAQGRRLTMNVGFSHPVIYEAPEGVQVAVHEGQGGAQARIVVSGIDKQKVGQAAADIRFKRKPEPYKGKGIRYENEVIHWKAGKTAVG